MLLCVTTVEYKVCMNGTLVGPIEPGRGLRQGDPLSPYLFLLCVEGLSHKLMEAAEKMRFMAVKSTLMHQLSLTSFLLMIVSYFLTRMLRKQRP